MLTELLMQDERRAGRIEGQIESILTFLSEIGSVSVALQEKIMQEKDTDKLKMWVKLAAKVDSVEQFAEKM